MIAQLNNRLSQSNEKQLELAIRKYFKGLREEVLNNLEEYWSEYQMLQGHIDLIIAPVENSHEQYYQILAKHDKREYQLGNAEAKRLIDIANGNINLKIVSPKGSVLMDKVVKDAKTNRKLVFITTKINS